MPTAALVLVGEELLTGKFPDENGPWAIRRLRELGTDLRRISVIPDDATVIGEVVAADATRFDVVLTSGGVGPTHDDVTFAGIAQGFGLELEVNDELVGLIRRFGLPENDASRQMATIPAGAVLHWAAAESVPVVQVRNVFVFPGVPRLFKRKLECVAPWLTGAAVDHARLRVVHAEVAIAAALAAAAVRFPSVAIGSYPRSEPSEHVLVTLDSRDPVSLSRAFADLLAALAPADILVAPGGAARG